MKSLGCYSQRAIGQSAQSIPISTTSEMLSQVMELNPGVVYISALPPFALDHARALYTKLRAQSSDLHIVICLRHFEGDQQKARTRMKLASGYGFFTTLSAILQLLACRAKKPSELLHIPSSIPTHFLV